MNNNTKCDLALRIRPLKAALQISFRDIQFISAYHDKILLPYTGDLPQVIQQYIINDALETCYTVKEMQKMQATHSDTFGNIISDCHTYIGLKTSRSKPIIVFQINYITKSGYESEQFFVAEASQKQITNTLNRFSIERKPACDLISALALNASMSISNGALPPHYNYR